MSAIVIAAALGACIGILIDDPVVAAALAGAFAIMILG